MRLDRLRAAQAAEALVDEGPMFCVSCRHKYVCKARKWAERGSTHTHTHTYMLATPAAAFS